MAIRYRQSDPVNAWRFQASHYVHTEVAEELHLVTMTGIAVTHFKGTGPSWVRDRLHLTLNFPDYFLPRGKLFLVDQWAPFVTLNVVYNYNQAINGGWAVDAFGGPGRVRIRPTVDIWADLAVSDIDGDLVRVGYTLTLLGRIVDPPPLSPDDILI